VISEYEKAEWQSRRHAALVRHIRRYLSYTDQYRKPSSETHNALEAERINLLLAANNAYRLKRWKDIFEFTWTWGNAVTGFLSVRGYWEDLRAQLERGIESAKFEGDELDPLQLQPLRV
jgi:hypothetical protein